MSGGNAMTPVRTIIVTHFRSSSIWSRVFATHTPSAALHVAAFASG